MKIAFLDTLSPEIISFLEHHYQSSFLTGAFLQKRYIDQGYNLKFFCVTNQQDQFVLILVFYIVNESVIVVSWLVEVEQELARTFETEIFKHFPEINRIVWQMSLNPIEANNSFSWIENSDMCIVLPKTIDDYKKQLSTNSRKFYANKTHRIERDLGKMVIDEPASDSNLHMVDILAEWKEKQMAQRGEKSRVVTDIVKDVLLSTGSISYIMNSERVISICLFYKVGQHIFLEQTAYDEQYSRYSPGRILLYWSILWFIEQGATHFHFLWKGADYKKHYLANEVFVYNTYSYKKKSVTYFKDFQKMKFRMFLRKMAHTSWGHALRQWLNRKLNGRTI